MAIAALRAGKHVYLEKPCSHNPAEGEMLVEAQQNYRKLVQMGTQQRSSPHTLEIVARIHEGIIGRPYFAKAWYTNVRKSIGTGTEVSVPPQLDWDLWQGPAPRRPYKDNVHPYDWHWFRNYGTGETLNNGTHEVDVCRWALGVDYPQRVTASGGRFHFKDDWQFYDTLVTSFEYADTMISWEGKSCQGMKYYGRDRGSTIMGTTGTVLVDRDGYEVYDLKGNKTGEFKPGGTTSSSDLVGRDSMTDAHFANFIAGIRKGENLNAPVSVGNVAVTMLQLSNIAWEVSRDAPGYEGRADPGRSGSDEDVGARVRNGLGTAYLIALKTRPAMPRLFRKCLGSLLTDDWRLGSTERRLLLPTVVPLVQPPTATVGSTSIVLATSAKRRYDSSRSA